MQAALRASRYFLRASPTRCMATVAKRQKMGPTIGTHSGSFHCDEALGTFLLKQTAAYADATITRTRDPAVLETLDVVIDVGGTYEPGGAGDVRWLSAAPPADTPVFVASMPLLVQRSTALITTSEGLQRCLGTASTPSCPAQVGGLLSTGLRACIVDRARGCCLLSLQANES